MKLYLSIATLFLTVMACNSPTNPQFVHDSSIDEITTIINSNRPYKMVYISIHLDDTDIFNSPSIEAKNGFLNIYDNLGEKFYNLSLVKKVSFIPDNIDNINWLYLTMY